ncbi:MAG: asparaginase [Ilumatobacteraceae bacterium]
MRDDNPILTRIFRDGRLESMHRGAWVLVDTAGNIVDCAGDPEQQLFPRSASKSLQALPLLESGASDAYGFDDRHLALALASHSGEDVHVEVASDGLRRLGLDESALQCGPQRPRDSRSNEPASRILNNCSGKHVGFLATAMQLGDAPDRYLQPNSAVQRAVGAAVAEVTGLGVADLGVAIDGCSAPTFRLPLRNLALGLGRVATPPDDWSPVRRDACRRLTAAASRHPVLVAGTWDRLCTRLLQVSSGRVFGKIGAEGVYVFGVVDADLGFAGKIDDGGVRGLHYVVLDVLARHALLGSDELAVLRAEFAPEVLTNWDGIEVGTVEVCGPDDDRRRERTSDVGAAPVDR